MRDASTIVKGRLNDTKCLLLLLLLLLLLNLMQERVK